MRLLCAQPVARDCHGPLLPTPILEEYCLQRMLGVPDMQSNRPGDISNPKLQPLKNNSHKAIKSLGATFSPHTLGTLQQQLYWVDHFLETWHKCPCPGQSSHNALQLTLASRQMLGQPLLKIFLP